MNSTLDYVVKNDDLIAFQALCPDIERQKSFLDAAVLGRASKITGHLLSLCEHHDYTLSPETVKLLSSDMDYLKRFINGKCDVSCALKDAIDGVYVCTDDYCSHLKCLGSNHTDGYDLYIPDNLIPLLDLATPEQRLQQLSTGLMEKTPSNCTKQNSAVWEYLFGLCQQYQVNLNNYIPGQSMFNPLTKAVYEATYKHNWSLVAKLLEHGLDPRVPDGRGKSALDRMKNITPVQIFLSMSS